MISMYAGFGRIRPCYEVTHAPQVVALQGGWKQLGQKSVLGAIPTTDAPTNDPTRASAQERCP